MLICDKHKRDRIPAFACPACLLDERNRLRAENEALRESVEAYDRMLAACEKGEK